MFPAERGQRTLRVLPRPSLLRREVESFLVDRAARGLSPRTVDYYREKLDCVTTFLESEDVHVVREITPAHLRRFLLREAKHRNPGGVHGLYRSLRAFLRWWEAETEPEGWKNPIAKVRGPRVPLAMLDPLSLDHLRAMLATCKRRTYAGERDRALLLALLDTGCRASEFLALDVRDLDIRTGAVQLRETKGKRPRTAFVGRTTLRDVSRYLRRRPDASPGEPLWAHLDGRRLAYSGLVSLLRRHARTAGIPPPLPHSFRRAHALSMLRGGADVFSLQRLLGHADLGVLRRYLKETEADLRAVHERAGPVDGPLGLARRVR